MSLPQFPSKDKFPPLEQSLSAIIASIAMEEAALSRLIAAENEKIQYVLDCAKNNGCTSEDVIAVNNSVANMMKIITELELILKEKLAIASKHLPVKPIPPKPPCPPHPPVPPHPPGPGPCPCPSGVSVFKTETSYNWCKDRTIFLFESENCNNGIKLIRRDGQSLIILPSGKEVEIKFELEATNRKSAPIAIAMEFLKGGKVIKTETISQKGKYETRYKTSHENVENAITFRLIAPDMLNDVKAKISIKVKK